MSRLNYDAKLRLQTRFPVRYYKSDWNTVNKQTVDSSVKELQNVDKIIAESYALTHETNETHESKAQDVAFEFEKRIKDLELWVKELQDKVTQIQHTIVYSEASVKRLNKLVEQMEPIVTRDKIILEKREHRIGVELVNDDPQKQILKELQLIEDIRVKSNGYLKILTENLRLLRKQVYQCNQSISCKKRALQIDIEASRLHEHSEPIAVHEITKPVDEWTVENEQEAEMLTTRYVTEADELISICTNTRVEVESFIRLSVETLNNQVCETNASFEARLWETRVAKNTMEAEHAVVTDKIREMEQTIEDLKKSYVQKHSSLNVENARIQARSQRPNLEAVNDLVQKHLRSHVEELKTAMDHIVAQIQRARVQFHRIQAHQIAIEEGINAKLRTIAIDETDVIPIRKQINVQVP